MIYVGILWNTVFDLKDNIMEDINKYGEIINAYEIDLGNQYMEFVKNIYECDKIAEWKVCLKLAYMLQSSSTKLVILFIKIDDTKKEYNERKNKEVIVNIENLKTDIRDKYSKQIKNYFFDNIFHMTDDKEELEKTLLVLNDWFDKEKNNNKLLVKRRGGTNENK